MVVDVLWANLTFLDSSPSRHRNRPGIGVEEGIAVNHPELSDRAALPRWGSGPVSDDGVRM